jgi:DnaJ-class molecular chaperone
MDLGIAVLAAALAAIGYAVSARIWPMTTCSRCSGSGRQRSPSGGSWRPCDRCQGTGNRKRG